MLSVVTAASSKGVREIPSILCKRSSLFAQRISRSISHDFPPNFAITREIPKSFVNGLSDYYTAKNVDERSKSQSSISIELAQSQHNEYVTKLRSVIPTITLPPLVHHPDSVFVEDTVVSVGKKRIVITSPGHPSRNDEVDSIKSFLLQLGCEVHDMRDFSDHEGNKAFCDGGDVLFTGKHLFVGISNRTNELGVQYLQTIFQQYVDNGDFEIVPVHGFDAKQSLHLKCLVTAIDRTTLLAPTGKLGDSILSAMNVIDNELNYYEVIRLPDISACNVVSVNDLMLAVNTKCAESKALLQEICKEKSIRLEFLDYSELEKCDGSMTCCSILLRL